MSKRIYLGDPRKLGELARRTGISETRLRQAAEGKVVLTPEELRKVNEARPRPDR